MKKWLLVLCLLGLLSFSATVGAESWENAGNSHKAILWLDIDSIRPVTLPDGTTGVPFLYQATYRSGKQLNNTTTTTTYLVDIQSGRIYPQGDKKANWQGQQNFLNFNDLTLSAFVYSHQATLNDRIPYSLTKKEADFGNRKPNFSVDKSGWKQSYDMKDVGSGWIQTKSAQLSTPDSKSYSLVRVLGKMEKKVKGNKTEILVLIEVNPNNPQQYRLLQAWAYMDKNLWLPINNDPKALSPLNISSEIAYLSTSAYEYLLTHPEEVQKHGYFTPGTNEKSPEEWLEMIK